MRPRLLLTVTGRMVPVAMVLLAVLLMPAESMAKKTPPKGTGNPYELLKGYWSGGGRITPLKGNPANVTCHATYTVAGNSATQNLRCAGGDQKFSTSSSLTYNGGKISGSWTESTYSAAGTVSGTAVGNTVHAVISGDKFSGRMSINISGSRHTITIIELDRGSGTYQQVASVSLHR